MFTIRSRPPSRRLPGQRSPEVHLHPAAAVGEVRRDRAHDLRRDRAVRAADQAAVAPRRDRIATVTVRAIPTRAALVGKAVLADRAGSAIPAADSEARVVDSAVAAADSDRQAAASDRPREAALEALDRVRVNRVSAAVPAATATTPVADCRLQIKRAVRDLPSVTKSCARGESGVARGVRIRGHCDEQNNPLRGLVLNAVHFVCQGERKISRG